MKRKATLPPPQATVTISHCTFDGRTTRPDVLALAKALEANANAIRALCESVGQTAPLLHIDPNKPDRIDV